MDGAVMALIPLKQTITVVPPGIRDEWGNSVRGVPYTLKARVDEVTATVQNQVGDEVLSGFTIMLDKLADLSYDHEIIFTNELGVTIKRKPIKIEPIRMINGKAALTTVYC